MAASMSSLSFVQRVAVFDTAQASGVFTAEGGNAHSSHPSFPHLLLLVFEAVLEVVCVSLPGYIAARQGMFDAESQKFLANLNVALFTPCLIFTKLGSQLTADTLADLAIIPFIFVVMTFVSWTCGKVISRIFRFEKRKTNFVTAMAVFGNSNSLPISLVVSLSQTLKGLHWDQVPNDNDDEVAARGILYLLIFQQLGQLVRWSWGYHVLLAPKAKYEIAEEEAANARLQSGQERYSDDPEAEAEAGTVVDRVHHPDQPLPGHDVDDRMPFSGAGSGSSDEGDFESGDQTPVTNRAYSYTKLPAMLAEENGEQRQRLSSPNTPFLPRQISNGDIMRFPSVEGDIEEQSREGFKGFIHRRRSDLSSASSRIVKSAEKTSQRTFNALPQSIRNGLTRTHRFLRRFLHGAWEFMNPPLWAMFAAIIVATVPSLQSLFFDEGTFVRNSVTRAISQSGGVAVPLILVVLGANLARNTLPEEAKEDMEDPKEERKLIYAALIARMFLPTVIMAPILALTAKFLPISILDDPIFIIVCFLLTGAPSALQLAQICQINNVYMGAMAQLLFQSYVVWILPSTLILVMCALEVVEWSTST